jgi:predicted metal-dependent hydrolase
VKTATPQILTIAGRQVDYRIVHSKTAKKLRIRVGINGVEVVKPVSRNGECVSEFLEANGLWIIDQLDRIERFRSIRRPTKTTAGTIMFHGESVPVTVEANDQRGGANQVHCEDGRISIIRSGQSSTPPAKSLENWLRKQARTELLQQLDRVLSKLKRQAGKVFVMGQRTKWGNCSSLQNLSFNWRLIMAPEFVLRYIVTHEAVHLAVPDHSQRFWLTVQSLCPETERAKQWLCTNSHLLLADLRGICRE